MSLADDLLKPAPPNGVAQCQVDVILQKLAEDDAKAAEAFITVLAMPMRQMASTVICRRLDAAGYRIGASSIQRHRRGDCKCQS